MCGIAGVYWSGRKPPGIEDVVDRMVKSIHHRGPDSDGRSSSAFAEVGFKRLSIIDLTTGDQPIANEDGSVECFLNGEIYNYRSLRDELTSRGHRLHTSSDTEVLPHLYEELGEGMFARLRGMFVICVIDHRSRSMVLARDQFGVKQLYHARAGDRLVFSSEMKGVLASGLIEPDVDDESLISYLALLYTPEPRTLVKSVMKLAPGSFLRLTPDGRVEEVSYYRLPPEPKRERLAPRDAMVRLVELLDESVRLQLNADVPVGISLSGGVDSSAIACLASLSGDVRSDLTALTISWPDTAPEEVASSRELCRRLGIRQEILKPEGGSFEEDLPLLAWISDEPVADPATYSQYHVAVAAGHRVRVLLGGAGGDELFGGYGHYVLSRRNRAYAALPRSVQHWVHSHIAHRWLDGQGAEALRDYRLSRLPWHLRSVRHLAVQDELELSASLPGSCPSSVNLARLFRANSAYDPANQQMMVDLQSYLPEQILPMMDRATMAASVEGRVPFIDVPLVEFSMVLDGRTKLGWPQLQKRLLKGAIAEWVPRQILHSAKSGMPSHFPTFMARHPDVVRKIVLGREAYARTVLPEDWLRARLASVETMSKSYPVLYALVIFEVWHRLFVVERTYDRPQMSLSELFGTTRPGLAAGL
jgi:asparagine synthase (glutamine-hydrolysing)